MTVERPLFDLNDTKSNGIRHSHTRIISRKENTLFRTVRGAVYRGSVEVRERLMGVDTSDGYSSASSGHGAISRDISN